MIVYQYAPLQRNLNDYQQYQPRERLQTQQKRQFTCCPDANGVGGLLSLGYTDALPRLSASPRWLGFTGFAFDEENAESAEGA